MYESDVNKIKDAILAKIGKGRTSSIMIVGVIIFIILFFRPWVQVGPGQRGIVLNFGAVQQQVLEEGLHLRIPVMQEIVLMDVKLQKAETDAAAASADLQDVSSRVALNYHIVPDKANIVYQKIGIQFKERIIDPAILEVVKAVTAKYSACLLYTSPSPRDS